MAVLSGCGLPSGPATVTTSAVFGDVGDLAGGAPVELADIPIGHVTSITLDGTAGEGGHVRDRRRPTSRRTSPPSSAGRPSSASSTSTWWRRRPAPGRARARLVDGSTIAHAEVVPGIEQLVSSGSAVFGAVNTSDLAQLVATGAQGLGGEGQNLRQLLDELGTVVHGYAGRTATIEQLVDHAEQLTASLGPSAQADAQAVSTLADTTAVLARQSDRLESLLQSLDDLSVQGRSLLEAYLPQIDDELHGLAVTAQTLQSSEQDIGGLIDGTARAQRLDQGATVGRGAPGPRRPDRVRDTGRRGRRHPAQPDL